MTILKEEINQSVVTILNLSKWKLVIVAVLAAVGLGLQKDLHGQVAHLIQKEIVLEHFDYGYLLLFVVPMLCAYVDMLVYERVVSIHLIAKYIREYTGNDEEMIKLQSYENFVENYRQSHLYFAYERFAQLAGSVVLGISLPILAWARETVGGSRRT